MTQTIDITPTWSAVLPVLIAAIENGTFEGQRIATQELKRMAKLADLYVASQDNSNSNSDNQD